MIISLAVLAFVLAFVYFYPLTLRFCYSGRRAVLQWLPRLCGGFAAPRPLSLRGKGGKNPPLPASKPLLALKRCFSRWRLASTLRLIRRLLRRLRWRRLYFRLCRGFGGSAECIFYIRGGDIISCILYGWRLYRKGGKRHVKRA